MKYDAGRGMAAGVRVKALGVGRRLGGNKSAAYRPAKAPRLNG